MYSYYELSDQFLHFSVCLEMKEGTEYIKEEPFVLILGLQE